MVRVWDLESRRHFSIGGPGYVRICELKRAILFFVGGLSGAKNGRRHIKECGGWTFRSRGRMRRVQGVSGHLPCLHLTGMAPKRLLVIFDFDWYFPQIIGVDVLVLIVSLRSMADQDTDRYVFEVNAIDLRRKMEDLEDTVQWTDLV